MNRTKNHAVIRHSQLQQQITLLANLKPSSARTVVSCYLDLREEHSRLETFVREHMAAHLTQIPTRQLAGFKRSINAIIAQLDASKPRQPHGLALFYAVDGDATLLSAMPFAAPLHNRLSVSTSPDLLPLIQLRELYGRFMFVLANPAGLQVVEVNLGEISLKAWIPCPVSGTKSEDDLLVYGKTAAAQDDLQNQVVIIEQLLKNFGYIPFFLAGDIDVMRTVRQRLAGSSAARLRGSIPLPDSCNMRQAAALCLRTLIESRASQARATSTRILHGERHQGQAVTGVAASLHALQSGIVDTLVFANDYIQESDWTCWNCEESLAPQTSPPTQCPKCNADWFMDLRGELLRLAGQQRIPVEFTDSAALHRLGGVGCLLHKSVKEYVQPYPLGNGTLDLVA